MVMNVMLMLVSKPKQRRNLPGKSAMLYLAIEYLVSMISFSSISFDILPRLVLLVLSLKDEELSRLTWLSRKRVQWRQVYVTILTDRIEFPLRFFVELSFLVCSVFILRFVLFFNYFLLVLVFLCSTVRCMWTGNGILDRRGSRSDCSVHIDTPIHINILYRYGYVDMSIFWFIDMSMYRHVNTTV